MKYCMFLIAALALLMAGNAYSQVSAGDGEETTGHHAARNGDSDDDSVLPLFAPFDDARGYVGTELEGVWTEFAEVAPLVASVTVAGTVVGFIDVRALDNLPDHNPSSAGTTRCWFWVQDGVVFGNLMVPIIGDGPGIDAAVNDYRIKVAQAAIGGSMPNPGGCD